METIEFIPSRPEIEGVFDPPVPSALLLPEWYKLQEGYAGGEKRIDEKGNYNHTVKHCMPALDAMTSGYIITVPQDIEVSSNPDGEAIIRWPSDVFEQVSSHSLDQINHLPLDINAWDLFAWKWNNPWTIKTPPGYSCFFTQPMWHEDIPFKCFPGVVDTDTYCIQPVNFPFVFRKGFRGTIKMGTPMIQVIPFKRVEWEHSVHEKSGFDNRIWERSKRRFGHRYKNDYRQPKTYK